MSWLNDWLSSFSGSNITQAAEDLLTWEEEADALLPNNLTAEDIAALEQAGWIVDLETGQLIREADANAYTVNVDRLGV